jgi:hypothetical protein
MIIKDRAKPAKYFVRLGLILLVAFWFLQFSGAVAAPLDQDQDISVITNPPNNAVVSGVMQLTGSADSPTFQFYVVDVAPEPLTGDQWGTVGATHDTPVINGILETWDTTTVPDGSYTLRLRVVKVDGNYSEFFTQQIVVANTQPIPTDTPIPVQATALPTVTPTDLPPTPTIAIEQPIVDTPTPRPVATSPPLEDPDENSSLVPTVTGFSLAPLQNACFYGAGIMLSVFVLFGFLAALRIFILGFIDRIRRN